MMGRSEKMKGVESRRTQSLHAQVLRQIAKHPECRSSSLTRSSGHKTTEQSDEGNVQTTHRSSLDPGDESTSWLTPCSNGFTEQQILNALLLLHGHGLKKKKKGPEGYVIMQSSPGSMTNTAVPNWISHLAFLVFIFLTVK